MINLLLKSRHSHTSSAAHSSNWCKLCVLTVLGVCWLWVFFFFNFHPKGELTLPLPCLSKSYCECKGYSPILALQPHKLVLSSRSLPWNTINKHIWNHMLLNINIVYLVTILLQHNITHTHTRLCINLSLILTNDFLKKKKNPTHP